MINIKKQLEKENLIGTKIGKLTIISLEYVEHQLSRKPIYTCVCECSRTIKVDYYNLIHGRSKNCRKCAKNSRRSGRWKGFGDIPGTFFLSIMNQACGRNKEFNITIEYIWDLFIKQNRKCALTGIDLCFFSFNDSRRGNASLDRINNNEGYIVGNVRWLDKRVNIIKKALTDNDFLWFCNEIVKFNQEKISGLIMPNLQTLKCFNENSNETKI